jgi:hypothetical protein
VVVIGHHGLGRFSQPAGLEVNLSWHLADNCHVCPGGVVEAKVSFHSGSRIGRRAGGPQIGPLIFDASPKPFDEYVVETAAVAVDAASEVGFLEPVSEGAASELANLVGIEDLGRPEAPQGVIQRLYTKAPPSGVVCRSCASAPNPSSPPIAVGDTSSSAAAEVTGTDASGSACPHARSSLCVQLSSPSDCEFERIAFPRHLGLGLRQMFRHGRFVVIWTGGNPPADE